MIDRNSSLTEFQENNKTIYQIINDRGYSLENMSARLHRHITHILKSVRKEKYDETAYRLCMAFSWTLATFNRFHVNLEVEMWKRFPGICPYCLEAPCCCKQRSEKRQKLTESSRGKQPTSLHDWQKMFAEIYPNIVLESAIHLAEEAGEVDEALQAYLSTHEECWFEKVVEELVDAVTNIFSVASCLKIDLATGMADYFNSGCPKCALTPCQCGYIAFD